MNGFKSTRRFTSLRLVVALLMVCVSVGFMAEASFGQVGAPTIAFLNPSTFAKAGQRGITVSDQTPDSGVNCCTGAARGYHMSAWVSNAPAESRVFFSVVQDQPDAQVELEITDTVQTSDSSATWETNWSIPDEVIDGPATLRAHLVLNEQQIAVAEQAVNIVKDEAAAHITNPAGGAAFGMFSPLADSLPEGEAVEHKAPIGVVDTMYYLNNATGGLKPFYSVSAVGTKPTWKACSEGEFFGDADDGLRCQLSSLDDAGKVTALAVVTNEGSFLSDWDDTMNQSGDAIALGSVYEQQLTGISLVTSGSQTLQRNQNSDVFGCSADETIRLVDQFGRGIAGANIDVHATGPSDSLKFDVTSLGVFTNTLPPDRAGHSIEDAYDCTSHPSNSDYGEQGEHQRFGAADRKHVESEEDGTDDTGLWSFGMRSNVEGVTQWTAWVDEMNDGCNANDDLFTIGELFVSGTMGWGQSPGAIEVQPYETFLPCTPVQPEPEPTPTDEPGGELDGSRTISLKLDETPTIGQAASFSGRINAARGACERNQRVVLKMRRPGKKFWVTSRTRTDSDGRFAVLAKARVPRDYRAVAPANSSCDRAKSEPIQLRAN